MFSEPRRVPGPRTIASTFLGLVPFPATPALPDDTQWHRVNHLPAMAFDHQVMVAHAHTRLAAKMSYTNIGFALAPQEFTLSTLRDIYCATLGYPVDATNLQRRSVPIHRRPVPRHRRVRRAAPSRLTD